MKARITVDITEAKRVVAAVDYTSKAFKGFMASQKPAIATAIEEMVLSEIEDIPGIGHFMRPRTRVASQIGPESIVITISGMTEAEAGYPPVSGGKPKANHNLWNFHEFGQSGASGEMQSFLKDPGGIRTQARSRAAGAPSGYQGAVARRIMSMTAQLDLAITSIVQASGQNFVDTSLRTATRGRVFISRKARPALAAGGVTGNMLINMNAVHVGVHKTGTIFVVGKTEGGGHSFLPLKASGIPTTIRRR
jgi:hypothetical protein